MKERKRKEKLEQKKAEKQAAEKAKQREREQKIDKERREKEKGKGLLHVKSIPEFLENSWDSWKAPGIPGKLLGFLENSGDSWKTPGIPGKLRGFLENSGDFWKTPGIPGNCWNSLKTVYFFIFLFTATPPTLEEVLDKLNYDLVMSLTVEAPVSEVMLH